MSAYNNVGIFWDYENCAPSSNSSGYHLIDRIRQLSHQFGSVNIFKAYLQLPERASPKLYSLRSELQACGVSLTDCPHNGKNSVDLMMIVDIMAFVKDNPAPATVILISGDRDFAYLLSTIRWRRYNVVLVSNTFMTHDSLSNQANMTFDWQADVLKARNDTDPSRSTSNRARRDTSTSTPGTHVALEPVETVRPLNNKTSLQSLPEFRLPLSSDITPDAVLHTSTRSTKPPGGLEIKPAYEDPVNEEDSTGISSISGLSSQVDDWVLTDHSPTTDKQTLSVDEGTSLSPVFISAQSSPEFVSSEVEGDIPSSPGYLLLLGESDDSAESTSAPVELSKPKDEPAKEDYTRIDVNPVKQNCDCRICLRSASATESVRSDSVQELAPNPPTPTKPRSPLIKQGTTLPVSMIHSDTTRPDAVGSTLNIKAPMFAPRYITIETSGTSTTPPQSATVPKPEFKDLIVVLRELRVKGIAKPQFSVVAPLLLARKPDVYQSAGVSQFKTYLQLAESMRIVTIEHDKDGEGWMSLCHPWHNGGLHPSPGSHPQPMSDNSVITEPPPPTFQDLVSVLNELRMTGEVEPMGCVVASRLLEMNPDADKAVGAARWFKDYTDRAVKAGVVTVKEVCGDGIINLCEDWSRLSSRQEPPWPSANPAETNTSSSPFHPLITVLQEFRTRGYTQPPLSEVFDELYWEFGQSLADIYSLVGASTMTEYVTAAISAGIISIEGGDLSNQDASVSLLHSEHFMNVGKTTAPLPSGFEDLTHVLEELSRRSGRIEFLFSEVEPLALTRNPQLFVQAGLSTFAEYVIVAAKVGIVIVTELPGLDNGWVKLRHQSVSVQQPPSNQNNPPNIENRSLENAAPASVFRDLVIVLQQLRSSGETEFRFTNVAVLLLKRNPNAYESAGVTKFKDYIELAVKAGIVSVRETLKSGDGWITLCETLPGNNHTSKPPPLSAKTSRSSEKTVTPQIQIPAMYRELVWMLRQRRIAGDSEPLFSVIAPVFVKNPKLLARSFGQVGAKKFKQYAESARDAGIITLPDSERTGQERMRLCPAWEGGSFIPVEDW